MSHDSDTVMFTPPSLLCMDNHEWNTGAHGNDSAARGSGGAATRGAPHGRGGRPERRVVRTAFLYAPPCILPRRFSTADEQGRERVKSDANADG
jgi:hypothetical protein